MGEIIGLVILNFIGACVRWALGSLSKKNKFTFKEYLNGPKNSSDFFDQQVHGANNEWIGGVFLFLVVMILMSLNF